MAYGSYLKLDNPRWMYGDFSTTNKLTGTIYTDSAKTTAKDLTGLTLKVRIYDRWDAMDLFDKTASIVIAANGTWSYAVQTGELPQEGKYLLEIEMTASGSKESTFPEPFIIRGSP